MLYQSSAISHVLPTGFSPVFSGKYLCSWRLTHVKLDHIKAKAFQAHSPEICPTVQELIMQLVHFVPGYVGERKLSTWSSEFRVFLELNSQCSAGFISFLCVLNHISCSLGVWLCFPISLIIQSQGESVLECFTDLHRLRNRRGECYLLVCGAATIYESAECEFRCLYSHSWSVCLGWRPKGNNEELSSSLHLSCYIASLPLAQTQHFSDTAILGLRAEQALLLEIKILIQFLKYVSM